MNWRLIFLLSLFGLAMAIGTVWFIPMNIEYVLWPVIFIIDAYLIAKGCSKNYFVNGFMVAIFNCIWITAAHLIFFKDYMAFHQEMANNMHGYMSEHPHHAMLIIGPMIGIISGIIIGLLSWIASKIVKSNAAATNA